MTQFQRHISIIFLYRCNSVAFAHHYCNQRTLLYIKLIGNVQAQSKHINRCTLQLYVANMKFEYRDCVIWDLRRIAVINKQIIGIQ